MKGWSRGDKIALFTLVVAVLGAIAAWIVVPEIRKAAHLDKSDQIQQNGSQQSQVSPEPKPSESPTPSKSTSPVRDSSQARPTKRTVAKQPNISQAEPNISQAKQIDDSDVDPELKGFWIDPTISVNNEKPLLIEFLRDSRVRGRTAVSETPWLIPGYVWYRNGEMIRLVVTAKNGNLNYEGIFKGDSIEGSVTWVGQTGQKSPWKLERIRTSTP